MHHAQGVGVPLHLMVSLCEQGSCDAGVGRGSRHGGLLRWNSDVVSGALLCFFKSIHMIRLPKNDVSLPQTSMCSFLELELK
jgi:hypothetical protein